MIYAVYQIATGALVATCDSVEQLADAKTLAGRGCAVAQIDITNWEAGGAWEPVQLQFLPRPLETDDVSPLAAVTVDLSTAKDGDLFRYDAATKMLVKQ